MYFIHFMTTISLTMREKCLFTTKEKGYHKFFNFLSSVRSTGLRTRACAFNLQVPYPRSNSGKRTFAYSAVTLFNCLDTDLKQIACVSPSSIIYSSRLNNFNHKLLVLFLKFASNVSQHEELICYDCRFSLYCNCIRR